MLRKIKKAQAGPSWFEVVLGAILAVILGVALGAAYLVNKPVAKVTAIPKDAPAGAIYYVEGAKDMNRLGVTEKRKGFVDGETEEISEGELNALLSSLAKPSAPKPAAPKPGDKAPPPPPDVKMIDASPLNAHIHDGKIQFADTVTFSLFGISTAFIVQATGTFVRGSSGFEFEPEVVYVGGCPVERLLFVRAWIMRKLLFTDPVPADIAAAWSKLADVTIDGSKLRLKAP